jgi:hypothetical protein
MNAQTIQTTALCLAMFSVATGCGKADDDSTDDSGSGCSVKFDVRNPTSNDGAWSYTAAIPTTCTEFFTEENGNLSLQVKVAGIEDERYSLKKAELADQTSSYSFPEGRDMQGGTIDVRATTEWTLPLASAPKQLTIVVVSSDGSSPTNSIESLTANFSVTD